jgi:hypothetical protein
MIKPANDVTNRELNACGVKEDCVGWERTECGMSRVGPVFVVAHYGGCSREQISQVGL